MPYLRILANNGAHIHILSFEKRHRLISSASDFRASIADTSIQWTPLGFTNSFGLIGKVWDLLRMHIAAFIIAALSRPLIVHARSYPPAQVGLLIKRCFGSNLLFDSRGLWVDERVDKGSWNFAYPWHRYQFKYYKMVERKLLKHSDHIVVLTQAVVPVVMHLGSIPRNRITVIPCSADFSHFKLATTQNRNEARQILGIPQSCLVLGYLGSVGALYMPDRFLQLIKRSLLYHPTSRALIITPDVASFSSLIKATLPPTFDSKIHLCSATREQVANWLPAMDILVSLILPTFARIGSSPTKLAEAWACGIPTITSREVGDVSALSRDLDAGILIDPFSDHDLDKVVRTLPTLTKKGGTRLRDAAQSQLSLDVASQRYLSIYHSLA